jgi:hypothetical protein
MSSIKKNDKEEYFIYNKSLFMDFIDVIIDNTKTYIQPQNESKDQQGNTTFTERNAASKTTNQTIRAPRRQLKKMNKKMISKTQQTLMHLLLHSYKFDQGYNWL